MSKHNILGKLAILGLVMVIPLSSSMVVKAETNLYSTGNREFKAGTANANATFQVRLSSVYTGLGADEWCDLDLYGYVYDSINCTDPSYHFITGSHDSTSIGVTTETAMFAKEGQCDYRASSDSGSRSYKIEFNYIYSDPFDYTIY